MANPEPTTQPSREHSSAHRVETKYRVTPRIDIFENDSEYLLLADLPGVAAESLRVRLEPPELVIEGDRTVAGGPTVRYVRTVRLVQRIDPEGIAAVFKHGVLRVRLTKRARRIQVRHAA
jgi:HSP20 family protein